MALVEPASEADPVAILLQFLVAFGNALNRGLSFRVEDAHHCGNLFAAIVGQTSKGRKGTSWDRVLRLMRMADATWSEGRVVTGLSSGEGLLFHVRDPITKRKARKDREGKILDYQDEIEDPGEPDKRLLVVETEFAKVLRAMKRDTSILSGTLRQAWDSGMLRTLTKNSPLRATDAHISVIAHVTGDELRSELDRTEVANGFLNRFLLACVRRSKCLPHGGDIPEGALVAIAHRVRAALDFGRRGGEMARTAGASARWEEVYPTLSEGKPGMLGAVTSRAEAQVTRLSCLYAVLDLSGDVAEAHLEAALALWRYCEDSARYLFGESLGEPVADKLREALRAAGPAGLTRTQITRDVFKNHISKQETDRGLQKLVDAGVASVEREQTGGRDIERWSLRSLGSHPSRTQQGGRGDVIGGRDSEESEIRAFTEEAISLGYGEESERCEPSEPSEVVESGPGLSSDWEPPEEPPW